MKYIRLFENEESRKIFEKFGKSFFDFLKSFDEIFVLVNIDYSKIKNILNFNLKNDKIKIESTVYNTMARYYSVEDREYMTLVEMQFNPARDTIFIYLNTRAFRPRFDVEACVKKNISKFVRNVLNDNGVVLTENKSYEIKINDAKGLDFLNEWNLPIDAKKYNL